ncbi:MAG: hypothetical protein IGR80_00290 [Synechococcales cyanobacterium K44_A2020_017]|uniref:hypothetical protein n=1 Tax=Leptolyngbya sp. CCY15150 TaxID=2767772 RepID=UPI001951809B|nr:hypothetical protein [Leptolyngbya sp. CCY15150]MBF2089218.1 hypothetical protein [Synechococcales cyanobacterium K32_A2020_035]MBF2093180.1 hypothetical protein [Synechococcales cyanobacterium K44_A2020_017]
MDFQANSNARREQHSTLTVVTPGDFDRWSQAVRQQMLDCLRKRSERSTPRTQSDRP